MHVILHVFCSGYKFKTEVVILFVYLEWVRLVHGGALWMPHFTS